MLPSMFEVFYRINLKPATRQIRFGNNLPKVYQNLKVKRLPSQTSRTIQNTMMKTPVTTPPMTMKLKQKKKTLYFVAMMRTFVEMSRSMLRLLNLPYMTLTIPKLGQSVSVHII